MRLFVVRHGECEANVRGIAAGSSIDSPLTMRGRAQAAAAAEQLRGQGAATIVSSPLRRAFDTAAIIRDTIATGQDIIADAAFMERDAGDVTGKPLEIYATLEQAHQTIPGGETDADLYSRLHEGVKRLKLLHVPVVLVTHNAAYRMLYCVLMQLPMRNFRLTPSIANGEIREFEI